MKDPCVRVFRALYGLSRSGFDWFQHFASKLRDLGFKQIESTSSLFSRDGVVVAIYVDDVIGSGPSDIVKKAMAGIATVADMKPQELANRFLGMYVSNVQIIDKVWRTCHVNQSAYALHLVERYKTDAGVTGNPRAVATPYVEAELTIEDEMTPRAIWVGAAGAMLGAFCSS